MRYDTHLTLAIILLVQPASGQVLQAEGAIEAGFAGALRGCEAWILDPIRWVDGPAPFLTAIQLGDQVSEVASIPDDLKPPPNLRKGNRSFRIDVSDRAGFAMTVSTEIPMCHIVGIGFGDFASAARTVLATRAFNASWERLGQRDERSSHSVFFQHRRDNRLELTLSQPRRDPERSRTIHLVGTAVYDPH